VRPLLLLLLLLRLLNPPTHSPPTGARLITAASDGDKRSVKQFLKDGVDVNSRDWDKTSSMSAAAQAGHFDVVKMLFQAGADVDAQDKVGGAPSP